MSQVAVVVRLPLKAGMKQQAIAGFDFAIQHALAEGGTQQYILHENPANENELWMYELYADQDSLQAHMGADWFKEFLPSMLAVLDGQPDMHFLSPVVGKGL